MEYIDYFKMQAKRLLKDYKTRFFNEQEEVHDYQPEYFDIASVFQDFGFPHDKSDFKFTLMNAQHIIAKLAGFAKWNDLQRANEAELHTACQQFNRSGYHIKESASETPSIRKPLPAPKNLYAWIIPNGVFGISVEFSFDSVEYSKKYMVYCSNINDIATAQPLAEGEFSPIKYIYRNNRSPHSFYWVRAFDGAEYGEWSEIAGRNR